MHGAFAGLALLVVRQAHPASTGRQVVHAITPGIVWPQEAGPGGGGGGGGNRMRRPPPRRSQAPGTDALTVAISRAPAIAPPEPAPAEDPSERLDMPARPLASGLASLPGAIHALPAPLTPSQGPGVDGGVGDGSHGGDGPGKGRGLGDGADRNSGGQYYRPGAGISAPVPLYRGTPVYTAEAMRARIEGSVMVACIVQTDGTCSDITVTRSLDSARGLDQEAVKAAARWRFRPGTRTGEAVPVLVTIELAFSSR